MIKINCFDTTFPRIIGGLSASTSLDCLDVDSSFNIIAGGSSNDAGILDSTASPNPIALLMNNGGLYRWAKYFSTSLNTFKAIKFTPDLSKVVGIFDSANPLILVEINAQDGAIINSYSSTGGGGTITSAGFLLDSSNNVYLALDNDGGNGELIKFTLGTPPVSIQWSNQMNKGGTLLTSVIFGSSENELYIGGFNKDAFNSRVHYTNRLDSSGSRSWQYGHNFLTFPPYHHVSRLSYHNSGKIIGSSIEQTGPQARATFFRLNLNTGNPGLIPLSYNGRRYTATGLTVNTVGINPGDGNIAYFALYYSDNSMKLGIMNFDSGSLSLADLATFDGHTLKDAYIFSDGNLFYVGQASQVNTAIPIQTLSQVSGFIMNNDPAQSCCTYSVTSNAQGTGAHGYAWATGLIYSWGSRGNSFNSASITNFDLFSTTLISTSWCSPVVSVTITPPVLVAQTHDISMTSNTTYTFPDFTLDVVCADAASIVYTPVLADLVTPAPLYAILDSATKTFQFGTTQVSDVTVTPIDIYVLATTPTGQTASTSFQLTITNLCATGTIAPQSTISPIDYAITDTAVVVPIPTFVTTPPYCAINFIVTQSDGSPLDPTVFTLDYVANTLTIFSNDNTKVGTTDIFKTIGIKIDGSLVQAPTQTSTQNADVRLFHECTLATLSTAGTQSNSYVLYSTAMVLTVPPVPFTSNKLASLCGNFVYNCYSDVALTTLDTSVFTFDPLTRSLTIQSFDRLKLGSHTITIQGNQGIYSSTVVQHQVLLTITDPCPTTIITTTPVPIQTYLVLQQTLKVPIAQFTESVNYCGPFTYTLSTDPNPLVISLDSTNLEIIIQTNDFSLSGTTYNPVITGTLFNGVFDTLAVTVQISHDCDLANYISPQALEQIYTIKDPEMTLSIPFFESDHPDSHCGAFTYNLQMADGSTVDPIFSISARATATLLHLQTNSKAKIGTYNLELVGFQSLATVIKNVTPIKVIIEPIKENINKGPPRFKESIPVEQTVNVKESLSMPFPQIEEPDNEPFKMTISVNGRQEIPSFMTFTESLFSAKPTKASDVGEYIIEITLTDENGNKKTSKYSFTLSVKDPSSSSSDTGSDESGFEVTIEEIANREIFATIFQITMLGEMKIRFSEEIAEPEEWEKLDPNHLNIQVVSENPEKLDDTKLNWEVIEFKGFSMIIQLKFSHPDLISNEQVFLPLVTHFLQVKDKIYLTFIQNELFMSKEEPKFPIPYYHTIHKECPRQKSSQQNSIAMLSSTQVATTTAVAGASIASIALSQSFQLAWTLINYLQLLLHLVLLSVTYPIKVYEFLLMLVKMANYEIIPTEDIMNKIYEFPFESDSDIPSVFTDFGYDSLNLFINLGIIIFYSGILLILVIFIWILHFFKEKHSRIKKLHAMLESYVYYNVLIRSAIEVYLQLCVCVFIALKNWEKENTFFSIVNTSLMVIFCLAIIIFPFFVIYFLKKNYHQLKKKDFKRRYDTFYGEFKYHKTLQKNFYTIFLLRRLILALNIVFLDKYTYFQISIQVLTSLMFFLYLVICQPFDERLVNFVEVVNEGTILACSYIVFSFTDFVDNEESKKVMGWIMMVLIYISIAINWIVLVYQNILILKWVIQKLRKKCKNRKEKQTKVKPFKFSLNKVCNTSLAEEYKSTELFELKYSKKREKYPVLNEVRPFIVTEFLENHQIPRLKRTPKNQVKPFDSSMQSSTIGSPQNFQKKLIYKDTALDYEEEKEQISRLDDSTLTLTKRILVDEQALHQYLKLLSVNLPPKLHSGYWHTYMSRLLGTTGSQRMMANDLHERDKMRFQRYKYEILDRETDDILDKALVKLKANRREKLIDAPTYFKTIEKINSLKKLQFVEDYERWKDKDAYEWMKYKVAAEVGGDYEREALKKFEKLLLDAKGEVNYRLWRQKIVKDPLAQNFIPYL